MQYTEDQMLVEKQKSFDAGRVHSKSSDETKQLLRTQMEEFKTILGAHETSEKESVESILHRIESVALLVEKHISETSVSDKTIRDLITGSRVARGWFYALVSIVAGVGVLAGSAVAVKEWIKR